MATTITRQTLCILCKTGKIPATMIDGEWDIDDDYIADACAWRKAATCLEDLLYEDTGYQLLSDKEQTLVKRAIRRKVKDNEVEGHPVYSGHFLDLTKEEAAALIADAVTKFNDRKELVPIADAAKQMGLSTYQCKEAVKKGTVNGVRVGEDLYVSPDEIGAWKARKDGLVGLYDLLKEHASEYDGGLFDLENARHRQMINAFVKSNPLLSPICIPWEKAGFHGSRRNAVCFPAQAAQQVLSVVIPYVRTFGLIAARKRALEADAYWDTHPENKRAIDLFSDKKQDNGMVAIMQMLIDTDAPEIGEWTNAVVEDLVGYAENSPVKITGLYLSQFLAFVKKRYDIRVTASVRYDYTSEKKNIRNTSPYSVIQYFLASYMAFNDDFISENKLIAKALQDGKAAYLWLYVCWHYVAAWRTSDINRIRVIKLPWTREEVRQAIAEGDYAEMADTASLLLEGEICGRNGRPDKTEERQKQAILTVHFAESLRPIIGLVYLLNWLNAGGKEIIPSFRLEAKDYISFFGDVYVKIFGRETFQNLRGCKAYLGKMAGIAEKEADSENKVMGYVVAIHARAHAWDLDRLSEVTSRYLQNTMEGYTADEIIRTLMDNGSCSFVSFWLMSAVYGRRFEKLDFKAQSALIAEQGMSAYRAETICAAVQKAYINAKDSLNALFAGYSDDTSKELAEGILKKVAAGRALTHIHGIQCLLLARGVPCPNGHACLGCSYAIYHRGALVYVVEFIREQYRHLYLAKTAGEKKKTRLLLEKVYLPALYEILSLSKEVYGMNVRPFAQEIKRIMEGENDNDKYIEEKG